MNTDKIGLLILQEIGLVFESLADLESQIIPREVFLDDLKYNNIKDKISSLKTLFSSSSFTCLHKNACEKQKFPLLNLVRQILGTYYFKMKPFRKSDGYTNSGVKKYKRFFMIIKNKPLEQNLTH